MRKEEKGGDHSLLRLFKSLFLLLPYEGSRRKAKADDREISPFAAFAALHENRRNSKVTC